MLHNFLSPLKQTTADLSLAPGLALAAASLDSQLGFAWKSPSPAQVAAISDGFIAQAGWPWAKHRWGLTLASTTWKTPGPVNPVDSHRSHWSTSTLPLQADPPQPLEVGGQWSQPVLEADWPE